MRAIDTNVVVRFLTNDDKAQARAARGVIEAGDIFIPSTVLLEAEWVLRSAYGFEPEQIVVGLRGLAGLPGISLEDPPQLAQALDWMERGMDFADALHLSRSQACEAFLTFDRRLTSAARGFADIPVVSP